MFDLNNLTKQLVQNIGAVNDAKISKATEDTLKEVKDTVVAEAVKESLAIDNIESLATDEEINTKLADYVKTSDIFKNGYFYTKYSHSNGSHALIWNESDGGGSQYFNKAANLVSYVGTNDGGTGSNDISVQIYSVDNTTKVGSRLNTNPYGIYYVKGGPGQGNPSDREVAVKADIDALINRIEALESWIQQHS